MDQQKALSLYQTMSKQIESADLTPQERVIALLRYARDKLAMAESAIKRNNIHDKGLLISDAIFAIETLNSCLDEKHDPILVNHLTDLYGYMINSLIYANFHQDKDKVIETKKLIQTLLEGWENITQG